MVVADTTAAFEKAARDRGVNLRIRALAVPSVTIDRTAFERALTNVLDNALRHSPPGGAIDIMCGEADYGAFVQVVDDGPGIAPDLLPRLFEPIVRVEGTRNGRPGGAGLGLTIAARLLRNQGGTIDAPMHPHAGRASRSEFARIALHGRTALRTKRRRLVTWRGRFRSACAADKRHRGAASGSATRSLPSDQTLFTWLMFDARVAASLRAARGVWSRTKVSLFTRGGSYASHQ